MPATPNDARAQRKADQAYAKATRPWWKKKRVWLVAVLAVLALVAVVNGGGGQEPSSAPATSQAPAAQEPAETPTPTVKPLVVTADKMLTALRGNALKASDTYKGKRVTVTGVVSNIDASGGYFSMRGANEFELTGITVNTDDDDRAAVAALSDGDKVTVTGEVTDVGEIIGYAVTPESIK